jgi:hypothetical protein
MKKLHAEIRFFMVGLMGLVSGYAIRLKKNKPYKK